MILLSLEQVVTNWPRLEEFLKWPRLEEDYTIEWLQAQIAQGRLHVWAIGEDLIVLTQIASLPNQSKVLEILWVQGRNVEKYIELGFDTFQRFAHFAGCKRIDIRGRPGWMRVLRRLPVEATETIMSVPVAPLQRGN
jgi:hypothetical protein